MRTRSLSVSALSVLLPFVLTASAGTLTPQELWDRAQPSLAAVMLNTNAAGQPDVNGTAFIIENGPEGLFLLTNMHVVRVEGSPADLFRKEKRVQVEFTRPDIALQEGVVVGVDVLADVALIRIDDSLAGPTQRRRLASLPAAVLGDSSSLYVGEELLALGHPLGNRNNPTFIRYTGHGPFTQDRIGVIRSNGSVSPGNSGGPLYRMNGEIVGVNTSMLPVPAQIAFSIPSNLIRDVIVPQLRRFQGKPHERVRYGALGVELQTLNSDLMEILGLPSREGALVTRVDAGAGGEADGAGLRRGDVVLGVEGRRANARGIDAQTLFSPWDLGDPKSPGNALRYEVIPDHLVRQDRGSDPGSVWRLALMPDRRNLLDIMSPKPARSGVEPRFTDQRRTLLRMALRQAAEGVWVERDGNDFDAKELKEHASTFIRELLYRDAADRFVQAPVATFADIEAVVLAKPAKVIAVLSRDAVYDEHSPARYVVVDLRAPRQR